MTRDRSKRKPIKKAPSRNYLPLWISLSGALVIVAALLLIFKKDGTPEDNSLSDTGTPVLAVDREVVDYGEVKLGTPVTTEFLVTNTGTGNLRFAEKPYVEIKEGC